MELLNVYQGGEAYREQVFALYEEAFPKEEKKPRRMLEELSAAGRMEIMAVVEEGVFLGLAIDLFSSGGAVLDYFAIAPENRSGGYGGRAVQMLIRRQQGRKYIFEIERPNPDAENARDRERRKAFYLRNGLKETGLFVNVYGTDFEMLTPDGSLTFEEYTGVLADVLGEEFLRRLNPTQESPLNNEARNLP